MPNPNTEIASGGGKIHGEVLAFRIGGGYASAVTVPAKDVFAKPSTMGFPESASPRLTGAPAARTTPVLPWQALGRTHPALWVDTVLDLRLAHGFVFAVVARIPQRNLVFLYRWLVVGHDPTKAIADTALDFDVTAMLHPLIARRRDPVNRGPFHMPEMPQSVSRWQGAPLWEERYGPESDHLRKPVAAQHRSFCQQQHPTNLHVREELHHEHA